MALLEFYVIYFFVQTTVKLTSNIHKIYVERTPGFCQVLRIFHKTLPDK